MDKIRLFEKQREAEIIIDAPYVFSLREKPYVPSKKNIASATITTDDRVIEEEAMRCATFKTLGTYVDEDGNNITYCSLSMLTDADDNVYLALMSNFDSNPFSDFKCDWDKIQYYEADISNYLNRKMYFYAYKLTDAEKASLNASEDEDAFIDDLATTFPMKIKVYFNFVNPTTVPRRCFFGTSLVELCDGALDGIEIIDVGAFSNNTSLKRITLPSTLKTIGRNAFCSTNQLEEVEYNGKVYKALRETKHYVDEEDGYEWDEEEITYGTLIEDLKANGVELEADSPGFGNYCL